MKFLGLSLILISVIGVFSLLLNDGDLQVFNPEIRNTSKDKVFASSKLLKPWKRNLEELKKMNIIPKNQWSRIKKVRVILLDENLHPFLKNLRPPIDTSKNGDFTLEVSFMSHKSEVRSGDGEVGIISQYNLIDNNSKEMVWEHSSTFYINH